MFAEHIHQHMCMNAHPGVCYLRMMAYVTIIPNLLGWVSMCIERKHALHFLSNLTSTSVDLCQTQMMCSLQTPKSDPLSS